jgi:hypothetical protein
LLKQGVRDAVSRFVKDLIEQPEESMKSVKKLYLLMATCLWMLPALSASAAGGGGAPIILVADTRKLTGIMHWWASLYNESHMQFTLLTIVLIPVTGCLFGLLADLIMSNIGIDLKSRKLAEH